MSFLFALAKNFADNPATRNKQIQMGHQKKVISPELRLLALCSAPRL
jgi:hypothetical protein